MILTTLAVGLVAGPPALADLAAGRAALEAKDYETALAELEPLARAGKVKAQYSLATLFYHGYGTPKNIELAREWFEKAVANRSGVAANALGIIYASACRQYRCSTASHRRRHRRKSDACPWPVYCTPRRRPARQCESGDISY